MAADRGSCRLAAAAPGLRLLVLHGARARREAHAYSDRDFACQADPAFDPDALLALFRDALNASGIDHIDLERAGAKVIRSPDHRICRRVEVLEDRPTGPGGKPRDGRLRRRPACGAAPRA
jgi:hypothetical protein